MQVGDDAYWSARITSYLANPNPINMCQRHLGRVMHVRFEAVESRTDTLHIVRCLMGTGAPFPLVACHDSASALRMPC